MSCCMRNSGHGAFLADMLTSARFEVLPTGSIEDKVLEHLPTGRTVTVTASPAKGLEATLALTERLAKHGDAAVPHLAARVGSGRARVEEVCARMRGARGGARVVPR